MNKGTDNVPPPPVPKRAAGGVVHSPASTGAPIVIESQEHALNLLPPRRAAWRWLTSSGTEAGQ